MGSICTSRPPHRHTTNTAARGSDWSGPPPTQQQATDTVAGPQTSALMAARVPWTASAQIARPADRHADGREGRKPRNENARFAQTQPIRERGPSTRTATPLSTSKASMDAPRRTVERASVSGLRLVPFSCPTSRALSTGIDADPPVSTPLPSALSRRCQPSKTARYDSALVPCRPSSRSSQSPAASLSDTNHARGQRRTRHGSDKR